jgi:hypothetical protein
MGVYEYIPLRERERESIALVSAVFVMKLLCNVLTDFIPFEIKIA